MSSKTRSTLFLILLFLILAAEAWFDVTSSNQAGLKDVDRSKAHMFIALSVLVHAFYVLFKRRKLQNWGIANILVSLSVWFIVVDYLNNAPFMSALTMIMLSFWWYLTYYFTYSYIKNNPDGVEKFLLLFCALLLVWTFLNQYARVQIVTNFDRDNAVTGYAYYFAIFTPFVLLLRDSIYKKVLLALCIVMTFTSFKRGTMVTLPVMLLVYGYTKGVIERKKSRFMVYAVLLITIASVVIPIIDEGSGGFLSARFSEEELASGSGRTESRAIALYRVAQRDLGAFLLGTGHGSSVLLLGTGVHNEWVEFLFSFGAVGLFLYFILGLIFLKQCYYYYKMKSSYAPHMCMMMAYFYMVSLFSGFMGVYVTYYFFAFMGLITALNEREIERLT